MRYIFVWAIWLLTFAVTGSAQFTVFHAISGVTYGITRGPDGNLWFTEYAANRIGRITPNGVVTEFVVPGVGAPFAITAGPDGNLWFTDTNTNQIGKITPAGLL